MALVSDIQLQPSAVKPPNLDTSQKFSAEGLTATTAFAVTDAGAGNTVGTCGLITARSSNDVRSWLQSTKADGNVELYMTNDARPDWALRVSGTADNAFIIANSYGSNCTAQFPAFSIGGAGAVGIGKTGATNILDIAYKNSTTGGIQITETQNNVGVKVIAEAAAGFIGTSSNHKLGFRVNNSTVGLFNTSGQFGIGTDSPGATLDVRGGAVFNEAGAAVDFRIEGDTDQNLFFVDGSADAIGMGTSTPVDTSTLHIMGTDGDPSTTHSGDAMLIVENNGNTLIEIGTSNTTYGGLSFSDAAAATRGAVLYDHGTGLGGAADTMMFQTAGSIRASIDASGCVGIGTNAPATACGGELDIFSSAGTGIVLRTSNTSAAAASILGEGYRANGDAEQVLQVIGRNKNATIDLGIFEVAAEAKHCLGALELKTFDGSSMTTKMKITSGGNVGIGTATPSALLDVFGGTAHIKGTGGGCIQLVRNDGTGTSGEFLGVLDFVSTDASTGSCGTMARVAASYDSAGDSARLHFVTGASTGSGTPTLSEKMTILSGGEVAIGSTTAASKLHVGGALRVEVGTTTGLGSPCTRAAEVLVDSNIAFFQGFCRTAPAAGTFIETRFRGNPIVLEGGNVGVGTAVVCDNGSNSRVLQVRATTGAGTLHLTNDNTGSTASDGAIISESGTDMYLINRESGDMYLRTADTNRIIIDSSGKVGIGTIDPLTKLYVNGTENNCEVLRVGNEPGASGSTQGTTYIGLSAFNSGTHAHTRIGVIESSVGSFQGHLVFETRGADSDSAPSERMRIANSGLVGIGTTVPGAKLDAVGDASSTQYAIQACALNTLCSYGARIFGKGACDGFPLLMVNHNTDEVLRVNTGGKVGIMTSAPCCTAHVYGEFMVGKGQNVNANALIALNSTSSAGAGGILQGTTNNGVDWQIGHQKAIIGGSESSAALRIQAFGDIALGGCAVCANSVEHMRIASNGHVSIGHCDRGNVFFEGGHSAVLQTEGTTPGNSSISMIRNNATHGPNLIIARSCGTSRGSNTLVATGQNIGGVSFQANDGTDFVTAASVVAKVGNHAASNCMSGELQFFTNAGSDGSISERMRIDEDGQVGIGTTAPVAAFHVDNGATISNLPSNTKAVFTNGDGADAITRVGIYAGGASAFSVLDLGRNNASCRSSLTYNASADSLTIGTAACASNLTMLSNGNMGIGTTAPVAQLTFSGAPGLQVQGHLATVGSANFQGGIYIGVAPNNASEPVHIDDSSNGGSSTALFIGNAQISVSSDRRVKNNIQCYTCSAINVLDNARVVEFEYDREKMNDKSDFGPSSRGKYVGLIAQEMIEYARWAINDGEGDPEGEHIWKAEYEHMVPLLIKAVQELNERIEELEGK